MKVQSCAPARRSASERAPGAPEATPQPGSSCHRGAVHVTGRVPHHARPTRLGHAVNGSLARGAAVLPFLPSWGAPFPPLTPPASTATLEGTVPPPRWTQIPASCSVAGVRAGSPGVWARVPPACVPTTTEWPSHPRFPTCPHRQAVHGYDQR